ncbi:MAG: Na+/H+ antiporter NhaC family protein [Lachnospiraceae bacterium]|nr:Na+/H+ antiporter NhaC family protein [Lachnospiraceae bacterium]MBR4780069.1 Na+/H+ antiporter NhaC family protein [Lachnospiraceae bacterium]
MKKHSLAIAVCVLIVAIAAIVITNLVTGEDFAFSGTAWALFPALVAIILALITKEAYSSLFIGIFLGAFMVSECSILDTVDTVTTAGVTAAISDTAGVLFFLVMLGIIVALINKSGASRAFGEWAQKHIKTKAGALLATFALGVLIFIDDYFNCLTVGSVMSPVTDSKKISRVKLAYIIDATAAPVCMIAPVSSWAAAVSGCVDSEKYASFDLFVRAIPYNFYSILTFVFIITIVILGFDYGKMSGYEIKAEKTGDLSMLAVALNDEREELNVKENGPANPAKGKIYDIIIPVLLLIGACIWGLIRNGYQNIGEGTLQEAFSDTDATIGLPWGGILALVLIIIYLVARKVVSFEDAMKCIPKGFMAMVPAITILVLATSLKNMTGSLDAKAFVQEIMANASDLQWALPAIVFVIACIIAFATGTSWGTFGILIPIVTAVFPEDSSLFFVGISACLAGAVCGDHCSPISDTTIMSSAGAHCDHIAHVETQLPYAISVAGISFVTYILAGLLDKAGMVVLSIPIGIVLTICFLFVMKAMVKKKA